MKPRVLVVVACLFFLIANPIVAAASGVVKADTVQHQTHSGNFPKCVINTIKLTDEAKKLTPRDYQALEQFLKDVEKTKYSMLNTYETQLLFKVIRIARFIGYDFVFLFGAVQSCL